MAQVKGTDAVGGGSTVNKAWVNKVAEEKWAAEQEEKRRRERVEDQAAQNRAYNDANAQKQEQLAAQRRAQEQAAAQKAAQEKAQREAAIQAARQRAIEEQQLAAQAAADRAAEREERRQREAAAAQAEASRNLSYSGGGISQKNQDREAEWQDYMKPHAPKVSTTEAAEEPAAESESWKAPDNVAEVEVSTPRRSGENRAEAQAPKAPIVYTPQDTTEYSTTEARGMAANTKAALTEEESGMSQEQLAWLQTPEGQAALARQNAQKANDAALRSAAQQSQYRVGTPGEQRYDARYPKSGNTATIAGQPITADKTISGRPIAESVMDQINADPELKAGYDRNVQAWIDSGWTRAEAEANALRGIADQLGTPIPATTGQPATQPAAATPQIRYNPRPDTSLDRDLRYPVAKMTADRTPAATTPERTITFSAERLPESEFLTGQDRIENEQLAYERGLASYTKNNGAQVDSSGSGPVAEWFRTGQEENKVYDNAYQTAYDQVIAAGGSYNQADQVGQNAGNMAVRQYRANQPEAEKPVSEGTTLFDEIVNAGNGRRSGENRAEANAPAGSNQGTSQGPQIRYVPRNNGQQPAANDQSTTRNGSVKQTTSGGVSGGQTNNRPGADAALQQIMDNAAAAGLTYGGANQPAANGTAAGSTTSTGTGTKTTGSNTGTGEARAEKNAPKGKSTYFTPSYGQAMDKGVKLPYKAGGYTAAEIEAAGNKARSDQKYYTGDKAYEGYYLAPDGRYYPVDQEKAAYYKANGNSYKGWEEPMREYYNTFGTFYGYRPDWKTAGGKNVWKQNRTETPSRSYSYSNNKSLSYTPTSSSRSYGRGSTANNGMYWNGLTSWNA